MNNGNIFDARDRATLRTVLPLVALGSGLATAPAGALELGDLIVESNLGQPLRASIAYALAPNEMLSDTCVAVSPSTGGLPGIGRNSVTITERSILIAGDAAVREPMLGARVTITCPYTPNLSREYMLFVDPAGLASKQTARPAAASAPVMRPEPAPQVARQTRTARRAPADETPIGPSTRYQVQPGDTLSGIVQRIENRSMTLWPAVNAIFAANPDAFIDDDPNKLKAGSWLTIPSLDGSTPVVAATPVVPMSVAAARPEVIDASAAEEPASPIEPAVSYDPAAFDEPVDLPETETEPLAADGTTDLKPGDVVLDSPASTPAATIVIPDTPLEGPVTASTSPNVPTAIISTGSRSESTSLLMWLAGGGLAILAALLLFGRRLRDRFGSSPIGAAAAYRDRRRDEAGDAVADYDIDDDSPTHENLVLDADLVIGSGLEQGVDVDFAQDFGFAATTDLDIELPFEPQAPVSDDDTGIIAPVSRNIESILESEVFPEDDDYDMSVIVDATKMPQPEDVTERDLKAVPVHATGELDSNDDFTISKEVDYDILEQDYEEELTATQALNQEIARAAAELARDLDRTIDDEKTAEMPASGDATDVTAEMPARDKGATTEFEAAYDPNDTNALTVNMSHDDETTEMPVANDDETTEMEIEGGRIDTRKR